MKRVAHAWVLRAYREMNDWMLDDLLLKQEKRTIGVLVLAGRGRLSVHLWSSPRGSSVSAHVTSLSKEMLTLCTSQLASKLCMKIVVKVVSNLRSSGESRESHCPLNVR